MDRSADYIRKIGIGSVQFGLNYGINNQNGKVKKTKVFRILQEALRVGIDVVDTACGYGESEQILGQFDEIGKFRIVSKFPKGRNPEDTIKESLKRLNIKSLYGFLSHSFDFVKNNNRTWENVLKIKKNGLTKKIGFSLYYPEELEFILKNDFEFDIVQLPYNVFDRRFEPFFGILKTMGVEIHVRSVFLQGLFFVDLRKLNKWFEPVVNKLNYLHNFAKNHNIRLSCVLILWALSNKHIDNVIVGVDSFEQFKNNIDLDKRAFDLVNKLKDLTENNEKIIVPALWRLN